MIYSTRFPVLLSDLNEFDFPVERQSSRRILARDSNPNKHGITRNEFDIYALYVPWNIYQISLKFLLIRKS